MPMPRDEPSGASMADLNDAAIVAARPQRNRLSAWQPYAFCVEDECGPAGRVEPVATLFLTNRECPFRCVMCDLWKNTLTERVPAGAIPAQIDFALGQLPPARHIKLYNSGNFFDAQAIPPADHAPIAERVSEFETVIVENHPNLCGPSCADFRDRLEGELEIALGLETIHPEVLPRLNKRMTVDDYDHAVESLLEAGIHVRTFILLAPPFLPLDAAVEWCLRSVRHAFEKGVRVCSIIPTRGGNGAIELLAHRGEYSPPTLRQLESVHAAALALNAGRVFVDLWDVEKFADCRLCAAARIARLQRMNLQQRIEPAIACNVCEGSG
jgi:archaeosine synthase beta-subunit